MIRFIHYAGLSASDIPYYKGIDYDAFFETYVVHEYEDGDAYYPSFYLNAIKVDASDFGLMSSSCNLIEIKNESQGVTAFYSISKITYINENVYSLSIKMDTILTFMGRISLSDCVVNRALIERWKDEKINRAYIRENLSVANKVRDVSSFKYLNDPSMKDWMLVTRWSEYDGNYETVARASSYAYVNDSDYSNLVKREDITGDIKISPFALYEDLNYNADASAMFKETYISAMVDAFVIPFNPVDDITVASDGTYSIASAYVYLYQLNYEGMSGEVVYYVHPRGMWRLKTHETEIIGDLGIARNEGLGRAFDWHLVPACLDENYISLVFGSNSANEGYPLHLLEDTYLWGWYTCAFSTGSRTYGLLPGDSSGPTTYEDAAQATITDDALMSYEMINDNWATYVSANKYRWAQIQSSSASGVTDSTFEGAMKGMMSKESTAYEGAALGLASGLSAGIGGVTNQFFKDLNARATPATISGNAFCNDKIHSGLGMIFRYWDVVQDIAQVAKRFEREGYRIDAYEEKTIALRDLLDEYNIRHYWGVICAQAHAHLSNFPEDDSICSDIERRLTQGLRYWNVANEGVTFGDYSYDNVEEAYL